MTQLKDSMSNIEKIRQEIERRKKICEGIFERESDTYYQGKAVAYGELLPFIDSLPEEKPSEDVEQAANEFANQDCVTFISRKKGFIAGAEWQKKQDKDWLNGELMKAHLSGVKAGDMIARTEMHIQKEKPKEDIEQEAARYERDNRQSVLSSVDIVNAFIEGARWQANQLLKGSPLPEDTVLFQKGVEEGRRLEKDEHRLTWQDMAKIDAIILDVNNEFAVDYSKEIDRQKFYEEVLKRFKEVQK